VPRAAHLTTTGLLSQELHASADKTDEIDGDPRRAFAEKVRAKAAAVLDAVLAASLHTAVGALGTAP
jgi:hypothetical protein